jgi:hypothetical protein
LVVRPAPACGTGSARSCRIGPGFRWPPSASTWPARSCSASCGAAHRIETRQQLEPTAQARHRHRRPRRVHHLQRPGTDTVTMAVDHPGRAAGYALATVIVGAVASIAGTGLVRRNLDPDLLATAGGPDMTPAVTALLVCAAGGVGAAGRLVVDGLIRSWVRPPTRSPPDHQPDWLPAARTSHRPGPPATSSRSPGPSSPAPDCSAATPPSAPPAPDCSAATPPSAPPASKLSHCS